jgi:hypothetical protein
VSEERAVVETDLIRVILSQDGPPRTEMERRLWMATRQSIIMQLGAIEDYLDMPRSIVPRHKREDRRAS